VPGVFSLIASAGVAEDEMQRTFNLGLGMVVAVAAPDAERAIAALAAAGQPAAVVGAVRRREPGAAPVSFAAPIAFAAAAAAAAPTGGAR
jgi:phosphoribosylformylglycinamidine cyclo-ligase